MYIDVNDPYLPSDIGAQILNTSPEVNFTQLSNLTPDIALQNLSLVNSGSGCTAFNACSVYLTARETPTRDQPWLHGVLPNANGQTEGATSAAVVVNDHGSGLVDAYYFYFYAFNQGNNVSGTVIGNHVGDWEVSVQSSDVNNRKMDADRHSIPCSGSRMVHRRRCGSALTTYGKHHHASVFITDLITERLHLLLRCCVQK